MEVNGSSIGDSPPSVHNLERSHTRILEVNGSSTEDSLPSDDNIITTCEIVEVNSSST